MIAGNVCNRIKMVTELPAESSVAFSCPRLFGCLSFGRLFESQESLVPESVEPIPQCLDSAGVDRVDPSRAHRMNSHQSCCHEDFQVLRDCGATHVHPVGDLAYGSSAAAQALQHRPPCRISQGVEGSLFVSYHLQ